MSKQNSKLVKRYERLAIAAILLLALLLPLGTYIFWVLGGAAAYFVFLVYFYSPHKSESKYQSHTEFSRTQQKEKQDNQRKKIAAFKFMISVGIIGLVAALISFFWTPQRELAYEEDSEDRNTLVKDADNLDALTSIGNRFYASQEYDSALFYYTRVLEVDPQNSGGMYNKALVLYQMQAYDRSIALLKACVNTYPEYGEAYALLGDNFYLQEKNLEALNWYRKAYDSGVKTSEVLNLLGYLYDTRSNTTEAIRFYKEALEQDSTLIDIYDRLAYLDSREAQKYQQMKEKWTK